MSELEIAIDQYNEAMVRTIRILLDLERLYTRRVYHRASWVLMLMLVILSILGGGE